MKKFLLGLFGTLAIALPAQAQSFDLIPESDCTFVVDYICRDRTADNEPLLLAVPSGYDQRYVLIATELAGYNFIFMWDALNEQTAAYILLDDNARIAPSVDGEPSIGGNISLLQEVSAEVVEILNVLLLY